MEIIRRDGDYALRALVNMTQQATREPITIAGLASEEDVPVDFLRKVFLKLARAGIVKSRRGVGGGYELAHPAGGVSVLDVVEAVQGPVTMNRCHSTHGGRQRRCDRRTRCSMRPHFLLAEAALASSLAGITLRTLAATSGQAKERRRRP